MRTHPLLRGTAAISIATAATLFASSQVFGQSEKICLEKQLADLGSKPAVHAGSTPLAVNFTPAPGEEAAYKAFLKLKPDDPDARVEVGDAFVRKYPDGPFSEVVYSQLSIAAYRKQDFLKMGEYADKALAINPNDITVLVFTGWVIPHAKNPAAAQLEKAEQYEIRALKLLSNLKKPAGMSHGDLTAARSQYESQAHSGLGLVYYRRNDFGGAVDELTRATADARQADPADYYVLGNSLDSLQRFAEAADAFARCAAIPGGEQALCEKNVDVARKRVASKPTPPEVANASGTIDQVGSGSQ